VLFLFTINCNLKENFKKLFAGCVLHVLTDAGMTGLMSTR